MAALSNCRVRPRVSLTAAARFMLCCCWQTMAFASCLTSRRQRWLRHVFRACASMACLVAHHFGRAREVQAKEYDRSTDHFEGCDRLAKEYSRRNGSNHGNKIIVERRTRTADLLDP